MAKLNESNSLDLLECAKEVIKLLEQQKTIYRNAFQQCVCVRNRSTIKQELEKLDDQIGLLYQKCNLNSADSPRKNPIRMITGGGGVLPSNSFLNSPVLGIDMKSLVLKSDSNNNSNKRYKSFKCNHSKCRFTCFTEKSLIKHQLEHRRSQFLAIIEPHGFTLSEDNQNIIFSDDKTSIPTLRQCCFPFCTVEFTELYSTAEIIIEHLNTHLLSYIFYPCFNCLKIYNSPKKLNEHLVSDSICKEFATFPDISTSKWKCKLCDNSYSSERMLRVHCNLLHDQPSDVFEEYDQSIIQDNIFENEVQDIGTSLTTSIELLMNENEGKSESEKRLLDCEMNEENVHLVFEIESDSTVATIKDKLDDSLNFEQTGQTIEHEVVVETTTNNIDPILSKEAQPKQVVNETSLVDADSTSFTQVQFLSPNNDFEVLLRPDNPATAAEIEPEFVVMDANSVELLLNNGDIIINNDNQESAFVLENEEVKSSTAEPPALLSTENNPQQLKHLMNLFIYECSNCTFSFRSELELAKHNYEAHNITSYKCPDCDFVTQDIETFQRHEATHKNKPKQHICLVCSESFQSTSALESHRKLKHVSYECKICKMAIANRFTFNSHMVSFHRDSILKCDQCKYKTYHEENFEKHKQIHTTYKCCADCSDSFANEQLLEAHINKFHKREKPYKCSQCGEAFYNAERMNKHLVVAHNHHLYKCELCAFKTKTAQNLYRHMNCHNGEKPFNCPEKDCFSKFRTKSLLDSHLTHRHSNVKAFHCEWNNCERSFKTKHQLKQHYKKHTGSEFSCPECEAKFTSSQRLRVHQAIHTRSIQCPYEHCPALFAKKSELNTHVKTCNYRKEHSLISRINPPNRSLIVKPKFTENILSTEITDCDTEMTL